MTLVTYVIMFFLLYRLIAGLLGREAENARLLSSTNVVLDPSNYTITQDEFEMAIKLYNRNTTEDMFRYIRPVYGLQGYTWIDGGWSVDDVWE